MWRSVISDLSIASANSVLSIASHGSILSIGSAGGMLRFVTCRQHPAHRRCWRYPRQEQEIGTRSGSALPERHGTPYQREGARWHGALG